MTPLAASAPAAFRPGTTRAFDEGPRRSPPLTVDRTRRVGAAAQGRSQGRIAGRAVLRWRGRRGRAACAGTSLPGCFTIPGTARRGEVAALVDQALVQIEGAWNQLMMGKPSLSVASPTYVFMMQIRMVVGYFTACPVSGWGG